MSEKSDPKPGKGTETTDDVVDEALASSRRSRALKRQTPKRAAELKQNPFYAVVFKKDDAETKKAALATNLAYDVDLTKEDNKEQLVAFETFKAWLMDQRKRMAQEIIDLTDTDTFAELKDVFDEMNQGLLDFEGEMAPLSEILDAVYRLRMASDGAMFDVFREIQEDKAEEARVRALWRQHEERLNEQHMRILSLQQEIAKQEQDKSWFGLGELRPRAKRRIRELSEEVAAAQRASEDIKAASKAVTVDRETKFSEYSEEKAKLRSLLDISSEEHRRRQQALVDSANAFVNMAETRTAQALDRLQGLSDRIEKLENSNRGMRGVYALIGEAVQVAEDRNTNLRDSLLEGPPEEDSIAETRRVSVKMAVEDYVTALTLAKADTVATDSELTAESYRIQAMKDSNNNQIARARSLNSRGVSGVASRLSTVLQGVSMAALGESSELAQTTLGRMNEQTTQLSHKEALKNAVSIGAGNSALAKAIEELETYGKIARAATDISREGYEEMKVHLDALQRTVRDVSDAVNEAVAVGADVIADKRARGATSKPSSQDDPLAAFGQLDS